MDGPPLRLVLLLVGTLFLGGLAWWELRRPRQARGSQIPHGREAGEPEQPARADADPRVHREPTLTLPPVGARDPLPELPTIEVVGESEEGFAAGRDEDIDLLVEPVEPIVPWVDRAQPGPPPEVPSAADAAAEPIVDWPQEGLRRIIALRLVAGTERFAGHAVRQALVAEGFVLGKLSIFHRPGPDGRALISAASLTQPGSFDRDSIDRQRYAGLSLFAVLPGPLTAVHAFDELCAAARNLNERLRGELQDERGDALTPVRAAELREALEAHDD